MPELSRVTGCCCQRAAQAESLVYRECLCGSLVLCIEGTARRFETNGEPHFCGETRPRLRGTELICLCGQVVVWTVDYGHLNLRDGRPHQCDEWRARSR